MEEGFVRVETFKLYPTKEQKEFLNKEFDTFYKIVEFLFSKLRSYESRVGKIRNEFHARAYLEKVFNPETMFCNFPFHSAFGTDYLSRAIKSVSRRYFVPLKGVKRAIDKHVLEIPAKNMKLGFVKKGKLFLTDEVGIKIRPKNKRFGNWKLVQIKKQADVFYATGISFKKKAKEINEKPLICGIDLGVTNAITLVNNAGKAEQYSLENHKLESLIDHVFALNKKLVRMKVALPNSFWKTNSYKNLTNKKTKLVGHIQAIQREMFNRFAERLFDKYDFVSVESLEVDEMYKKEHVNTKRLIMYDFKRFRKILRNHAAKSGKICFECNRYFPSSQICSWCGTLHKSMRIKEQPFVDKMICECGYEENRDINACINLMNEMISKLNLKVVTGGKIDVFRSKNIELKKYRNNFESKTVQMSLF